MGTAKSPHRLMMAFSLVLCGTGVFAAYSEAGAHVSGGLTAEERFEALLAGEQVIGLSITSTRLVLDNCYDAMTGIFGRLQAPQERAAVAEHCLGQVDAITSFMPSHSFAWFVGALAALQLDRAREFSDRLLQSQRTGPSEQWIAELRVGLAEDNYGSLPREVRELNARDLGLLVASSRGISSIAQRYLDNPAFRARITDIVEGLPERDKRRFLFTLESAAGLTEQPS